MIRTVAGWVALCWLIGVAACAQPAQPLRGAWLQDGIKWAKAPKEINPKLSSGRGAIVYFGTDHAFALMYATVNRVPGEYEVVCDGCGQVVYLGTWEVDQKTVKVKYRLINRTVEVPGEKLPGPVKEDTAKVQDSSITFLGNSFHRASALDASVREFVSSTAR